MMGVICALLTPPYLLRLLFLEHLNSRLSCTVKPTTSPRIFDSPPRSARVPSTQIPTSNPSSKTNSYHAATLGQEDRKRAVYQLYSNDSCGYEGKTASDGLRRSW